MANLLQQEADLEAQIKVYRAQLKAVQEKVSDGGRDMDQILTDLEQLIDLSEQNLVELKKHKLLMMLHEAVPPNSEVAASKPVCNDGEDLTASSAHHSSMEVEDEWIGMMCRAPLKESWGGESHHNAIVLCREPPKSLPPGDDGSDHDETSLAAPESEREGPELRVLFTQPLYPAMKPCSFFLEGICKFSEQECRFSHGHVVHLSRLHPYVEPDYNIAHVGGRCLARHEDGLWHQAIISSVGEEYVVYFPSLSLTSQVSREEVLPLGKCCLCSYVEPQVGGVEPQTLCQSVRVGPAGLVGRCIRKNNCCAESSDESTSSEDNDAGSSEGEEEGDVVVEWKPSTLHHAMGQWEQHTTGIGSKLLARMGYVVGQGLGKQNQGRVDPVEIVILPAGKSLDVCAELREAKKVKIVDGLEVKKRKRKKKKVGPSAADERPTDMFEFLNTKVFSRGSSATEALQLRKSDTGTSGNLNIKLFKVQEEVKAVVKKRKSIMQSLARHQKRKDKQLIVQAKEKLASVDSQLEQLHRQEKSLEKSIETNAI